jgi:hypothetical protein
MMKKDNKKQVFSISALLSFKSKDEELYKKQKQFFLDKTGNKQVSIVLVLL